MPRKKDPLKVIFNLVKDIYCGKFNLNTVDNLLFDAAIAPAIDKIAVSKESTNHALKLEVKILKQCIENFASDHIEKLIEPAVEALLPAYTPGKELFKRVSSHVACKTVGKLFEYPLMELKL